MADADAAPPPPAASAHPPPLAPGPPLRPPRRLGPGPGPEGPGTRLMRFDRVQRAAHWANALLFAVLVLTALPLYFSAVERLVGRHVLVAQVHLWAGVALPLPLVVAAAGPWGARMRRDLRRVNRWREEELRWLWTFGRLGRADDKFNPGQKLNTIFVGGTIAVMLGTGCILEWFGLFPVTWRTGATFVHEALAFAAVVVVVGHVAVALTHPEPLRAMVRGWVGREWAERHAPRWLDEEQGAGGAEIPTGRPGATAGRTAWTRSRTVRRPPGSPRAG